MKKYRILALLLALVMVLGLTACGKEKKSDDPNHFEFGDYVLDYKGACIMYGEYGRDALVVTFDFTSNSRENTPADWAITSKCMQGGVQVETAYVLADADTCESISKEYWLDVAPGVTLEVKNAFQLGDMSEVSPELSEFWSGDTCTITVDPSSLERIENGTSGNDDDWDLSWICEDEDSDENSDEEPADEEPAEKEPVASFTDWWEGDWYGWWIVDEAEGDYEGYYGYWWDAFAKISVDDDMTGTVNIWDEDGDTDNLVGASVVSFTATGSTEHGTMVAESGSFMGATFEPAEWVVDPAQAPYDEMIMIEGTNVGDNGSYHYSILLRPWGALWDDVAEADRPYYYNDWYLAFVEADAAMPDKFDAEAVPEAGSSEAGSEAGTTAAFTGAMTPFSVDGATFNKTAVPISFSLPEACAILDTISFNETFFKLPPHRGGSNRPLSEMGGFYAYRGDQLSMPGLYRAAAF